jgi:hypothetical protein
VDIAIKTIQATWCRQSLFVFDSFSSSYTEMCRIPANHFGLFANLIFVGGIHQTNRKMQNPMINPAAFPQPNERRFFPPAFSV